MIKIAIPETIPEMKIAKSRFFGLIAPLPKFKNITKGRRGYRLPMILFLCPMGRKEGKDLYWRLPCLKR